MKLSDEYRSITSVKIGNGSSALFWSDLWKNGILDVRFSRLFSFAKHMFQSVKEFLQKDSMLDNIAKIPNTPNDEGMTPRVLDIGLPGF
jgi:hypothetical protein